MKKNTIILLFLSIGLFSLCGKPAKFAKGIVDVGIVAEDLERTVKFYTEAVGLKEIKGFEASAEKATQFGLTDNQPARVRVFVLGDAPGSARLKIMAFPKRPGTKPDQKFIHSTVGISYLTLRFQQSLSLDSSTLTPKLTPQPSHQRSNL